MTIIDTKIMPLEDICSFKLHVINKQMLLPPEVMNRVQYFRYRIVTNLYKMCDFNWGWYIRRQQQKH